MGWHLHCHLVRAEQPLLHDSQALHQEALLFSQAGLQLFAGFQRLHSNPTPSAGGAKALGTLAPQWAQARACDAKPNEVPCRQDVMHKLWPPCAGGLWRYTEYDRAYDEQDRGME